MNRSDLTLTEAALVVATYARELDRALTTSATFIPGHVVPRVQDHLRKALAVLEDVAEGGERTEVMVEDPRAFALERDVDRLLPIPPGGPADVEDLLVRRHVLRCKLHDLLGTIRGLEAKLAEVRS